MRETFLSSISAFSIRLIGLSVLVSGLGGRLPVQAAALDWQYHPEQAALEFQLDSDVTPKYFLMPNPLRLVVDLPNTQLAAAPIEQSFKGDVSRIRVSEFRPGITRVVMELAPNSVLQDQQVALEDLGNGQWQIRPLIEVSGREIQPLDQSLNQPGAQSAPNQPETAIALPVVDHRATAENPAERAVNLAVDPFLEALPTVPAARTRPAVSEIVDANTSDPNTSNLSTSALGTSDSKPAREPRVPFLVKFGEPLPGINQDFPSAYAPPSDR